jgi:hypothetical protein
MTTTPEDTTSSVPVPTTEVSTESVRSETIPAAAAPEPVLNPFAAMISKKENEDEEEGGDDDDVSVLF